MCARACVCVCLCVCERSVVWELDIFMQGFRKDSKLQLGTNLDILQLRYLILDLYVRRLKRLLEEICQLA